MSAVDLGVFKKKNYCAEDGTIVYNEALAYALQTNNILDLQDSSTRRCTRNMPCRCNTEGFKKYQGQQRSSTTCIREPNKGSYFLQILEALDSHCAEKEETIIISKQTNRSCKVIGVTVV